MMGNLAYLPSNLAAVTVPVGQYLNAWKALPLLLLMLLWTKLLTWADKDEVAAHLPRMPLNTGMFSGFVAAVTAFFLVPNFFAGLGILIVVFGVEVGIYLMIRN